MKLKDTNLNLAAMQFLKGLVFAEPSSDVNEVIKRLDEYILLNPKVKQMKEILESEVKVEKLSK